MTGTLNHSPAHVLANLIVDLGHGVEPDGSTAWSTYVNMMPDSPDSLVYLVNTAGKHDGRSMVDGSVFHHHGWQMMVRAVSDNAAWVKANTIAVALDAVNRRYVPIGDVTYRVQSISRIGAILYVGLDETSRRRIYSVNGYISLRQMAGTGSYT